METCRARSSRSLSLDYCPTRSRSLSPGDFPQGTRGRGNTFNATDARVATHNPLSFSHSATGGDGRRPSSLVATGNTCAEFDAAVEALQGQNGGGGEERGRREGSGGAQSVSPFDGGQRVNLTEMEKCKMQIQVLYQEAIEWRQTKAHLERRVEHLQHQLGEMQQARGPRKTYHKRWTRMQGSVGDVLRKPIRDDVIEDPLEIVQAFTESERLYLNNLVVLDAQFQQPMKMLSALEPEMLSSQQLQSIFLNCSELLLLHRYFCDQLALLPSLPRSTRLDEFFCVLEQTIPSFSMYSSFMKSSRQQTLQKELRSLRQKELFVQLLNHCQENCGGKSLQDLLVLPTERFNEYINLLRLFLGTRVRDLPSSAAKRVGSLVKCLSNLKYELLEEKCEWDQTLEKIKLLQKLAPDGGPIPMEIFDSDVRLVRQGTLNHVVGKKEVQRFCFLFSSYFAVGERSLDTYRILQPWGMIPLHEVQLHKCVDVEGQVIEKDLQSGLKEDLLAFKLTFANDSLFFRAAKPRERTSWLEALESSIAEAQKNRQLSTETGTQLYPETSEGPKIAAASLEKLFQQLTSPRKFRDDFVEVFLMTHSCFTTTKDVLTALLNCVKRSDVEIYSDTSSQGSDSGVFVFNMEEYEALSNGCVSASPSFSNITSESETSSPAPASPMTPRRSRASLPPSVLRRNAMDPGIHRKPPTRSSASTSDSDTSPHTSAVVVDNALGTGMTNGWVPPDMGLKLPQGVKMRERGSSEPDTNYVTFVRHSQGSSHGSELEWESELSDANDEDTTPCPSLHEPQGTTKIPATPIKRSMSDNQFEVSMEEGVGDEETLKAALNSISHSEKMALELDEASRVLQELTEDLTDFSTKSSSADDLLGNKDETIGSTEDRENAVAYREGGVVRRRSKTISGESLRHSVISLSNSEPDLTLLAVHNSTPSPRSSRNPFVVETIRVGPHHSELLDSSSNQTDSLSSSVPAGSKFWVSSPRRKGHSSCSEDKFSSSVVVSPSASPHQGKERRESKLGKLVKRSNSSRKGDTLPATPVTKFTAFSQGRSSTMASFDSPKTPTRGFKGHFKGFRKNVKKLVKNPDEVDGPVSPARDKSPGPQAKTSVKRSRTYMRKNSLSNEMTLSTSPLAPVDEMYYSGQGLSRRESTTRGNTISLVSKIFSILTFWQHEHFEDFEADEEVRAMLEDFLRCLVSNNRPETLEHRLAQQLLDVLSIHPTVTPPDGSFSTLLVRSSGIDPQMCELYEWTHPDKLMVGREIDLSKTRDSTFLRTLAEQLTVMEFAVFSAVQRCELLNCNWKKVDKERLAPNLTRLIRRTNEMTSWVCTEILSRETPESRATVIEHFVQVATYCYRHNDMHCALNITIALSCSAIKGLSRTWEVVDKKYRHKFDRLKEWTDHQGRCRKMREDLEKLTAEVLQKTGHIPNALPYIGAYLEQIYSLEMNSKTYNDDGLVNFAKMTKLTQLIKNVLQYQKSRFTFEPRLEVIAYVTAAKRLSENELYELSLQREPSS